MDYTERIFSRPPRSVDRAILVDADAPNAPNRSISWRKYSSLVKRIAIGLRERGLKPGECVTLLSTNNVYYWVFGDGVIAAGGIFCGMPMINNHDVDLLASNLKVTGAKWLFVESDCMPLASGWMSSADYSPADAPGVYFFDPPGYPDTTNGEAFAGKENIKGTFTDLLASDEKLWDTIDRKDCAPPSERIAWRMFTSGTTSGLKTVEITHQQLIARIDAEDFVPMQGLDRCQLQYIHLSIASGQMICQRAAAGYLAAFVSRYDDAQSIIDTIYHCQISVVQLTPRVMEHLTAALQKEENPTSKLNSLNHALVGGAISYKYLVEKFAALLPTHTYLRPGYGQTEAGLIALAPPGHSTLWYDKGLCGAIVPGVEVRILDYETAQDIPSENEGEICVRSAWTFERYYENPAANEKTFIADPNGGDKWVRTGDCGYFDKSTGQLILTGRFNEAFMYSNMRVIPSDVEAALTEYMQGAIYDVAVTSSRMHGYEGDERLITYVVRKNEQDTVKPVDIHGFVAAWVVRARRFASVKPPKGSVVFVESIPRNAMSKIVRRKLPDLKPLEGSDMDVILESDFYKVVKN